MPTNHELFAKHVEAVFGEASAIHGSKTTDGLPPVCVFVYKNIPEPGMITGITYGLSLYAHPAWKFGRRPEIIVTVNSLDVAWPCAAATFVADFRGQERYSFSYGDVFTTDCPLAPDTKMDGFLIFAQSILAPNVAAVQVNDYKIQFSQFYPIYRSEVDVYERIGLEQFWKHPGFDMYDIRRSPIRA